MPASSNRQIVNCVFSENDSMIVAFSFGGGKRWLFLFDVNRGLLAKIELPIFTRQTTVDIAFINGTEIIVAADRPKIFYKIRIGLMEE